MGKTIQIMIDKRGVVTNGDVIKAVFPNVTVIEHKITVNVIKLDVVTTFSKNWWSSPYKECDIDDSN